MESIEMVKNLLFLKLKRLGLDPICCYYGGSLLNGTYNFKKSDVDVVVVISGGKSYCHTSMKLVLKNLEYSLLFDSLWEYEEKKDMSATPVSRLYGYLNSFGLLSSDIAIFEENQKNIVEDIFPHLKSNAKIAAEELISRDLNIHPIRKEDYHLLQAINISERFNHKIPFEDIVDCKNGRVSLASVLKKEGIL